MVKQLTIKSGLNAICFCRFIKTAPFICTFLLHQIAVKTTQNERKRIPKCYGRRLWKRNEKVNRQKVNVPFSHVPQIFSLFRIFSILILPPALLSVTSWSRSPIIVLQQLLQVFLLFNYRCCCCCYSSQEETQGTCHKNEFVRRYLLKEEKKFFLFSFYFI